VAISNDLAMAGVIAIVEATKSEVLPALEILLGSYLRKGHFSREVAEQLL